MACLVDPSIGRPHEETGAGVTKQGGQAKKLKSYSIHKIRKMFVCALPIDNRNITAFNIFYEHSCFTHISTLPGIGHHKFSRFQKSFRDERRLSDEGFTFYEHITTHYVLSVRAAFEQTYTMCQVNKLRL